MAKNKLTGLSINEVSLVDRGAIGEVFSLMKMEDPDNFNSEILKQFTGEELVEKMKNMPDDQFISIMKELQTKYEEVNKGGNEMNEEQIKELVSSVVQEVMDPVNKNFSKINKSIDELQKTVGEVQKACKEDDVEKAKKCPDCGKPLDQCTCKDNKKDDAVTKALETLTQSVTKMSEGLGAIGELKTAVENLTKSQDDVAKRVDEIEKQENPSNKLDPDKVTKDAGNQLPKTNFWKSVIGSGIEPDKQ